MNTNDLANVPDWNLVHRLRERWGVSKAYADQIAWRLGHARYLEGQLKQCEERCKFLEQHVPAEIAHPPVEVRSAGPRYTGD